MPRYFIRLAYNGACYAGWQVQPNAHTVQAELEKVLGYFFTTPGITGCGRTDTGVHASDYYAHIDVGQQIEDIQQTIYKLNKVLPPDISIKEIAEVTADAHARFSATERVYEYKIERIKNPFTQGLAWYYHGPLDVEAMNIAAAYLLEIEDFKAFSRGDTDVKTTLCNVTKAEWREEGNTLVFTIAANRFLRNMVRAVVGTLVDVGRGKITLDDFKQVAQSLDRGEAGDSAPAQGLYLCEIKYPETIFIKQ